MKRITHRFFYEKLRKTIILTISLLWFTSSLFAFDLPAGNYYFDNSQTQWASVYLFVGHGSYVRSYQLTSPNDIYTVSMSVWSGATGYYFANNNGGVISGSSSFNINTLPGSFSANQPTSRTALYSSAPTANQYYIPWSSSGTGISGEWKSDLNVPSAVLSGTNVMFYINQSFGGSLGITDNSSSTCKTTSSTTTLSSTDAYLNIAAANVPSTLSVTNNCGGWVGTGAFASQTSANAAGARYVTGASTSKTTASVSASPSLSSIPQGTTLIYLQATTSASTSSYGRNMYIQYYVDGETSPSLTSNKVTSTSTSTTYMTGSLSVGTHTIIPVLTDRLVFLKGNSFTVTVTPTTPYISGISSSLPAFSSTQTYKGATVRITGLNLNSVSIIKLGGSGGTSITTSSPTTISATDIFFEVPDGTSAGTVYVSDGTNTSTSSGSLANLGYITTSTGNWSSTNTWLGSSLPTSTDNVTVAYNTTLTLDGDRTVASLTTNFASGTFNNGSSVLTIAAGGTITNNGYVVANNGTISFAGSGTVTGSNQITFKNLTLNTGTLTLSTVPTIDGVFTINNGNVSASPKYTSNSTLFYNVGYNRYLEWSATGVGTIGTTAGYPNNVTINNGTFTVVNGDAGTARALAGNLVVNTGATFSTGALNALVTVGGSITNSGIISLSSTTGRLKCIDFTNNLGATTSLSSNSGGDLEITGSLLDNGTFNANTRAVFFTGSGTQDVSGNGTFNIDYLVSNKSAGSIRMLCDLLCEGPNTGHAITLTNSTDILDLNGHVLTIGKAGIVSDITGSGSIKGSSASGIIIYGSGALGTLSFTSGSQSLNNLTIDRQTSGTVTLGSALTLNGLLTLTNGTFSNSTNLTLANGAGIALTAGTLSSVPTFGTSVNLTYNGSATKGNEFPGTNIINTLTVNNSAGITLSDDRNIANLTINTGSSLNVSAGKKLTVATTFVNNGTVYLRSTASGTATILTPSTITGTNAASVEQYLPTSRNWYVSSPVTGATTSAGYTVYSYHEPGDNTGYATQSGSPTLYWESLTQGSTYQKGKGYIALPGATSTIAFNGTLNTGSVSTGSLTRTVGKTKEGFNLIGNPYPAYLNLATIDTTKVWGSYWLRSKNQADNAYDFDTYNLNGGLGISKSGKSITSVVPPMQAFWVRLKTGQSPAVLTFNNDMCQHINTVNNLFRAPATTNNTQQILNLQVSNGTNIDESIIAFNSNASNSSDGYDTPKMPINSASIPEIYTLIDGEQFAINSMNSIPYDTEIPLGFTTGLEGQHSIKASQIQNFDPSVSIYLKDYNDLINTPVQLTADGAYSFYSTQATDNSNRFVLIFKSSSVTTDIHSNAEPSVWISVNGNNQLVVNGSSNVSSVDVYNALGQKMFTKQLTSASKMLQTPLTSGVYFVTVNTSGKVCTKKVVVK